MFCLSSYATYFVYRKPKYYNFSFCSWKQATRKKILCRFFWHVELITEIFFALFIPQAFSLRVCTSTHYEKLVLFFVLFYKTEIL